MTEITFQDGKLGDAVREWLCAIEGIDDVDIDTQSNLRDSFIAGWAACMKHNLHGAVDLCLFFLRIATIPGSDNPDRQVVLNKNVVDTLSEMCRKVVGNVDLVGLSRHIELCESDKDSEEPASSQNPAAQLVED